MYAERMRSLIFSVAVPALLILSGCGLQSEYSATDTERTIADSVPELSAHALGSADYMLIDPTLRQALTKAGQNFSVPVRDGTYSFPPSVLVGHYGTISVDTMNIAYGDLTGDGIPDAVIRVKAGAGEFSTTELAAFTSSGGTAMQIASFPLGHASVNSVVINAGNIHVSFTHTVSGDPGPRNTELVLKMPKK